MLAVCRQHTDILRRNRAGITQTVFTICSVQACVPWTSTGFCCPLGSVLALGIPQAATVVAVYMKIVHAYLCKSQTAVHVSCMACAHFSQPPPSLLLVCLLHCCVLHCPRDTLATQKQTDCMRTADLPFGRNFCLSSNGLRFYSLSCRSFG